MTRFLGLAMLMAFAVTSAASARPAPEAAPPAPFPAVVAEGGDVAFLTGRWRLFFGTKICWGQIVNLPGESQCV